jgi:hypothetical protein
MGVHQDARRPGTCRLLENSVAECQLHGTPPLQPLQPAVQKRQWPCRPRATDRFRGVRQIAGLKVTDFAKRLQVST